ncbi:MAG: UDP-glucose 4-epimerase GalE [Planctomycetota bacterium]
MEVLVTGGAGYIGSHAVRALSLAGYSVVVLDNLSCGHSEALAAVGNFKLYQIDLRDKQAVYAAFEPHRFCGVIHFAGAALVSESVKNPEKYYDINVIGGLNLLSACKHFDVRHVVFSSTCATYGEPKTVPISEDHPQIPINPYGRTKLAFEHILESYAQGYGLTYLALRYFNAAGADPSGDLGEDHAIETHLIPNVYYAVLGRLDHFTIFGADYPTPDGTCIRDYIHVADLARAHVIGLEYLLRGGRSGCFNLGTGQGYSVREVIKACEVACEKQVSVEVAARREGDAPALVAQTDTARKILGFQCQRSDIKTICEDAWRWHSRYPRGFQS